MLIGDETTAQQSTLPPNRLMEDKGQESTYPAPDVSLPTVIERTSPIPHKLTTTHSSHSITLKGWTITSTKLPISSSSECDEVAATVGIPVPEMTFGNNSVSIEGPGGWKCVFSTLQALDAVDKTGSHGIKVAHSEQWNRTR